jgi:uncharacterized metal-binding protein
MPESQNCQENVCEKFKKTKRALSNPKPKLNLCSEERKKTKDLILLVGVKVSIIKHFVAATIGSNQ